jgi:hypothetical protein
MFYVPRNIGGTAFLIWIIVRITAERVYRSVTNDAKQP